MENERDGLIKAGDKRRNPLEETEKVSTLDVDLEHNRASLVLERRAFENMSVVEKRQATEEIISELVAGHVVSANGRAEIQICPCSGANWLRPTGASSTVFNFWSATTTPAHPPHLNMSVSPAVMRRLMRELTELQTNPPEGIRVAVSEDNMLDVTGIIEGPEGTPYAGGYFRVKFKFTEEFPAAPPKCWFATKIFHPNVSSSGEICVNTLKKDWKSSYGIGHILVTVKCLLIYPNPESALDEEAGKLLLENYDDYFSRAKLITSVHATPRVRPTEFDAPSSLGTSPAPPSKSAIASALPSASSASSISLSTITSPRKSASPAPPSQPLQESPSNNTLSVPTSASSLAGEKGKDRLASPSPLGTADSNVAAGGAGMAALAPAHKALKRSAAPAETKRKKALKRL